MPCANTNARVHRRHFKKRRLQFRSLVSCSDSSARPSLVSLGACSDPVPTALTPQARTWRPAKYAKIDESQAVVDTVHICRCPLRSPAVIH